eukprot:498323-Pyramimonas_sp.AAC.1
MSLVIEPTASYRCLLSNVLTILLVRTLTCPIHGAGPSAKRPYNHESALFTRLKYYFSYDADCRVPHAFRVSLLDVSEASRSACGRTAMDYSSPGGCARGRFETIKYNILATYKKPTSETHTIRKIRIVCLSWK